MGMTQFPKTACRPLLQGLVIGAMVLQVGCASFIANNTTAPVGTDTGSRSLGQAVIDNAIERTAKINLYKLDPRFQQSRVSVDSFYSHVLLTGQVPDAALKQLAEENLAAMPDVKSVHNYLTVGPQISYSTIMQDLGATADARAKLMRAPVIRESRVKLHTENGVLYVMGRLNSAEIADLNDTLQRVINVVKIVSLIDNIDEAGAVPAAVAASSVPQNTAAVPVTGVGLGVITLPANDPTPVAIMPQGVTAP